MNKKYTIKIHSFIDLITNSSTEIYIEASDKTVQTVKDIVNNILKLGNSDITCDDLFEITLEKIDEDEGYNDYNDVSIIVKNLDEDSELGKSTAKILADLSGLFNIESSDNY